MYNIIKIEIKINKLGENIDLTILPDTLKCIKKGKIETINKNYIDKLLNIICLWKKEYKDNIIDGEKYEIKIYTSKGIDIYKGINNNQIGYNEFIKLVGELYG